MQHDPGLSIVIPAFNEAVRLGDTLARIRRHLHSSGQSWEIRVVDDGSTDGTADVVAAAAADDARIVLQREPHRGKGGAVRAGMLAANGARRLLCDADLSVPIAELPRFLARVPETADIAIGCRESPGARRHDEPRRRHVMGRVFNGLVRRVVLSPWLDTQCGFKLLSAEAARAVFSRVTILGWAFDVEVLVAAHRLGYRVEAIPVQWRYADESRVSPLSDGARMARDVLHIRFKAWRGDYG